MIFFTLIQNSRAKFWKGKEKIVLIRSFILKKGDYFFYLLTRQEGHGPGTFSPAIDLQPDIKSMERETAL